MDSIESIKNEKSELLFPKKRLIKLLIPLFIEQTLAITIGIADTMMVSSTGEAAVSGVALVDSINFLLIQVFSSLATGGAVIVAQYLGRRDIKNANSAAKQLMYLSTAITLVITTASLILNNQILRFIYGKIEADVMRNAVIYYYITAASYPFLAIYNGGAAIFRSMGNSKISMLTSFIMNVINISGNAILIFGFDMGVAGAAAATFASRTVGAVMMLFLVTDRRYEVHIVNLFKPEFSLSMVKNILRIGIPNGLENGMFQIGKLLVQGLITSFGTAAIAANAVANSLTTFAIMPGFAIGLSMVTVIGQCVGAQEYDQAVYYTKRLMGMMYIFMGITNLLLFIFARNVTALYKLSAAAESSAIEILRTYAFLSALIWPMSFGLPNSLRAAGDARATMITSVVSMWLFRIACCYLLALTFGLELNGVWYAMYIDWIFRAVVFIIRFVQRKWQKINVI